MRFWPTVSSLLACVLVAVAPASAQGPRAELNRIREIAVQETPDSTVVVVHGSSNPTFTVFKLEDPPRLFVDIANADVSSAGSTIEVDNGVIGQVGTLQFRSEDKPVGRVIIGLEREAVYNVVADGSDIRVVLDGAGNKGQASGSTHELRAEEERVRAAVDRERDLLQQLKLERLKEQRVQEQAAQARKAEEGLREQVAAARREAEQARAAEQAKVDALRAEQEALARQIAEQKQLETALSAEVPARAEQRQAEEQRLAELRATIESQRERVRARESELSRALQEAESRLATTEADYQAKQKASAELAADLGMQEARVRALKDDLDREQRRLDEVTQRRQTEEARVASLRGELDRGRKELDRVRAELQAAERTREGQEAASSDVQALRSELEAREAEVARLADALDRARAAEAEVARLQGELRSGQQALSEREQALVRLEEELRLAREAARTEADKREQAIRATERQLAAARAGGEQGTKAREEELARLEGELAAARAAARTEQDERAHAVERLAADLAAAREATRQQSEELTAAREAARQQGAELAAAREAAQKVQAEREHVEQQLQQEQSARQTAVAKLQQELVTERQSGERVVKERDQAISRLEAELEAARAAAAAAQATRDDLAKQSKGAQKGDKKRIEKALAAAKDAQTTADRLARELEAARSAATGAAQAREELASAIAERDQKIRALQGQLTANDARLAALEAERARIEEQARKDALAEARVMATKVAALEAKLMQERARGGAGSAQVRDLERQLGEERKQGDARAREAEKKLDQELAGLKRRLQAAEDEGASADAIEARYQAQIDRLTKQVEQSEAALATSDGRLEKLRAQQEVALQRAEEARAAQEAAAAQAALDAAAARMARAQASQDAEAARLAKEEARKAQEEAAVALREARAQASAAPAPVATLDRIDFRESGGVSRVEIGMSGEAAFEVIDQSGSQAVLLVRDVALPAALRRSLDTTDFHSAVMMVSSFESQKPEERGDVRVVVNLRAPVPNRVVRERGRLVWEFEKATALAPPAVEGSQPTAVSAARSLAPASGNVRYYPNVVSQAAAEPAAAPTAAGDLSMNPYFERKKKKRRYTGKRINLTIKDADIQHVLTFLAKEGKVNIIAGEDVTGRVTFHLEDIPWDLALDMILKTKGLDYVKEEGIYRVAPIDTIKKEIEDELDKKRKRADLKPLFVRLIPVNYGAADALSAQVKKILSPKGTVTVDKRTNTMIVKDIEDHIVAAEDLVRRLDLQTPQVLIEARIVEASSSYTQELGIQWGGNFAMSPVFGNETGLAFPSIVGLSGGATGRQTVTDGVFTNAPGFAVNLPAPVGQGTGGAIGLTLGNLSQSANINLRLSAAEEEGTVKIVSNPKIATLDNRQATIQQGISIPISVVSAQGVNTQFFNAELKLDVTPHVTRDGNVALKIDISKNEPDFGQTGANGNPTIQKKEAHTELLLRDGDTTVIGGIYTRNQGTNYSKVPLLADIPILGWLFKSRRESDQRTELLIFITPRIVNRQAAVTQP